MILYKYYGFEAGITALKNRRLGFREPKYFNDPFELSYLSSIKTSDKDREVLTTLVDNIKNEVVILSLTRTPFNPLMWAHYGQGHTGFVIGYDVSDDFLTNEAFNLIPVDKGDVIYTSAKSSLEINEKSIELLRQAQLVAMGGIELSDSAIKDSKQVETILRKIFLYKHSSWAYEEEVRVIKILQSLFHTAEDWQSHPKRGFDTITKEVKPYYGVLLVDGLHIYRHVVNITEVFVGIRSPLLNFDLKKAAKTIDNTLCDLAEECGWDVYCMVMDDNSWDLSASMVDSEILATHEKNQGLLNSFQFSAKEASYLRYILPQIEIAPGDNFEITNWDGEVFLKKNNDFVNKQ